MSQLKLRSSTEDRKEEDDQEEWPAYDSTEGEISYCDVFLIVHLLKGGGHRLML